MGFEIAGGLGVKLADPNREVYVLVGDGSYLMMPSEIVTSCQLGCKLTVVLMDNAGFKSIGALSRSLGQGGFGTRYVYPRDGTLPGDAGSVRELPVDLAANARSLGACVIECDSYEDVVNALQAARDVETTTVIYVRNDRLHGVPGYESWWDVPVAEVSDSPAVAEARRDWEAHRARERYFL
jgi:3D-(3,5/4)-trihydroxycyclohexane-1,2-dione acylhydrolase (decyclizing)